MAHIPFISPVGVVGNEERLKDDLGQNLACLIAEPVHVLSDSLVTEYKKKKYILVTSFFFCRNCNVFSHFLG